MGLLEVLKALFVSPFSCCLLKFIDLKVKRNPFCVRKPKTLEFCCLLKKNLNHATAHFQEMSHLLLVTQNIEQGKFFEAYFSDGLEFIWTLFVI